MYSPQYPSQKAQNAYNQQNPQQQYAQSNSIQGVFNDFISHVKKYQIDTANRYGAMQAYNYLKNKEKMANDSTLKEYKYQDFDNNGHVFGFLLPKQYVNTVAATYYKQLANNKDALKIITDWLEKHL